MDSSEMAASYVAVNAGIMAELASIASSKAKQKFEQQNISCAVESEVQ